MSKSIKIKPQFLTTGSASRGDRIAYLLLDVTAGAARGKQESTQPLNIALVIDRSGSMAGERLAFARSAARGIVDRLSPADHLSLVVFDDSASVIIDGIRCDKAGRASAYNAIEQIREGGSTNLSEGWFKGAECVGVVMEQLRSSRNAVIVLSDGHANRGTLSPVALSHHATELQSRGLVSSTVGIGNDYSSEQLNAIALNGGGSIHHAPRPEEIVEVVMGELADLRERLVDNLIIEIEAPKRVKVEPLTIAPCEVQGAFLKCKLGGLIAGASRPTLYRSRLDRNSEEQLAYAIEASWRESESADNQFTERTIAQLEETMDAAVLSADDQELGKRIAGIWQSWIAWTVAEYNRNRDYGQIQQFLSREINEFDRFCNVIPDARPLLQEVNDLARVAFRDWGEGQRKEMQHSLYHSQYSTQDKRSRGTQDWKDFLGNQ